MNRNVRNLLIIFFGSLIVLIPGFVQFAQDEAEADYSSLKIEPGVSDATINGYTQMRELAEEYDFVGLDDEQLAQQRSVSDWDRDAVASAITQNRALLDPDDGAPIRYSRERGIVYSVGADFADTGGSSLPFEFTVSTDEADDETAEDDESEPTLALRFLPKFER